MQLAQAAAAAWYARNQAKFTANQDVGVANEGTKDFVTLATADTVMAAWKAKFQGWNDLDARASISSTSGADQSINLKLAQEGEAKSCFNYHVLIGADPAAALKEKAIREEAAKMKTLAEANKVRLAAEATKKQEAATAAATAATTAKKAEAKKQQAMTTEYNAAVTKDAILKKADKKLAWEKSWLEKNKNRKF